MPFSVKDWQLRLPLKDTPDLHRMRDRLEAEIAKERDVRFEHDRARYVEQQTVQLLLPLFQQRPTMH